MNNNICAPGQYDAENNTCFTVVQLIAMCNAYNVYLTKTLLDPNPNKLSHIQNADPIRMEMDSEPSKNYLLTELKKRFESVCANNEICITKQNFMNEIVKEMHEDILNNTFRPDGPSVATEWLATNHINDIVKQYEKVYKDFIFLEAVPLDCDKLAFCTFYQIDFDKYCNKRLGAVFNHDKYGDPGSHWVALFINVNASEIYYCDSMGNKPRSNVKNIINKFMSYCEKKNRKATYKYNTNSYQLDSSECGIYSCNFIIRLLAGEPFDDVVRYPLTFKEINSCRNVYFKNKTSQYTQTEKCDPRSSI
jgi:hypothetical protein